MRSAGDEVITFHFINLFFLPANVQVFALRFLVKEKLVNVNSIILVVVFGAPRRVCPDFLRLVVSAVHRNLFAHPCSTDMNLGRAHCLALQAPPL
jgi:hypothetical protein